MRLYVPRWTETLVKVSGWLICRDDLQKRRLSMYYINLHLGRDKDNKSGVETGQMDVGCPEIPGVQVGFQRKRKEGILEV